MTVTLLIIIGVIMLITGILWRWGSFMHIIKFFLGLCVIFFIISTTVYVVPLIIIFLIAFIIFRRR